LDRSKRILGVEHFRGNSSNASYSQIRVAVRDYLGVVIIVKSVLLLAVSY